MGISIHIYLPTPITQPDKIYTLLMILLSLLNLPGKTIANNLGRIFYIDDIVIFNFVNMCCIGVGGFINDVELTKQAPRKSATT